MRCGPRCSLNTIFGTSGRETYHLIFASFLGLTRLRVTNRLKTTGTAYSHSLEARRLAGRQEPAGLCFSKGISE